MAEKTGGKTDRPSVDEIRERARGWSKDISSVAGALAVAIAIRKGNAEQIEDWCWRLRAVASDMEQLLVSITGDSNADSSS